MMLSCEFFVSLLENSLGILQFSMARTMDPCFRPAALSKDFSHFVSSITAPREPADP